MRAKRIKIAPEIEGFVLRRGSSQTEVARLSGVTQPKIGRILRGRLDGFTIDYLAPRPPRVTFGGRKAGKAPSENSSAGGA